MKIIVDKGGTKATWVLLDKNEKTTSFKIDSHHNYKLELPADLNSISPHHIESVYYYSSGLVNEDARSILHQQLNVAFPNAENFVFEDSLAACHACCGQESGYVGILGTGSNFSYYDGLSITKKSVNGGYLLDDYGSGYSIGQRILIAYINGKLSPNLQELFQQTYGFKTSLDLINQLYQHDTPKLYISSFAKFASEHPENELNSIVEQCFQHYFKNKVLKIYDDHKSTVNFVGGIAFAFRRILEQVALKNQIKISLIIPNPIHKLIDYYK